MCCGQKRSELRNSQAQRTAWSIPQRKSGDSPAQAARTQPSAPAAMRTISPGDASISIRYLENAPIRVRGLVSGLSYEFSGSHAIQPVDARDATSLLNTRFFRRAP